MWVQPLQKTYTDMYIYIYIYCIGVEMTYEGGGNEIRFDWPPAARTSKNILPGSGARICTGGWPPMWSASKKICAMRSCWFQQPFPCAISPRCHGSYIQTCMNFRMFGQKQTSKNHLCVVHDSYRFGFHVRAASRIFGQTPTVVMISNWMRPSKLAGDHKIEPRCRPSHLRVTWLTRYSWWPRINPRTHHFTMFFTFFSYVFMSSFVFIPTVSYKETSVV